MHVLACRARDLCSFRATLHHRSVVHMFKRSKVSAGVLAALGGALLGSVSPAMAQGETVVITGSRIRSP